MVVTMVGMLTSELFNVARFHLSSVSHFVQTQHTFCMQLGTQRVWDYIGGNLCITFSLSLSNMNSR